MKGVDICMDVLVAFFAGTGLGLIIGVFLFAIAIAVGRSRDETD